MSARPGLGGMSNTLWSAGVRKFPSMRSVRRFAPAMVWARLTANVVRPTHHTTDATGREGQDVFARQGGPVDGENPLRPDKGTQSSASDHRDEQHNPDPDRCRRKSAGPFHAWHLRQDGHTKCTFGIPGG